MPLTINPEKLWDQRYRDTSVPITIDGTPDSFNIADGSVTTPKIADAAVTSAKIADGAIVDGDVNAGAAIAATKLAAGTNGQVLTTVSGAPAWAAPAGGAPTGTAGGDLAGTYPSPTLAVDRIPKNLLTTKGDVIAATASATPARIGVGTDGQVLTADSAQTAGVKWATPTGGGGGGAPTSVEWAAATAYITGQLVSHLGILYQAATNFTSPGTFNTTNLTQIAVAPAAVILTGSVPYSQPGSAAIGSSGVWTAPASGTITTVRLSCVTAPVGSALTVAFQRNGSTFATLSIPAGSTTVTPSLPNQAFSAADTFAVNATSVGSTTAAAGVVAQIDYNQVIA